jgi:ABC-2 type transport system permease protein
MAPSAPAGSILWLLAHELRLSLRAVAGDRRGRRVLIVAGLAVVAVAALAGAPIGRYLLGFPMTLTPSLVIGVDVALAAVFTMVLSQTLSLATLALFERGDLELLLSSPLPPGRILAARAVAIASAPFLWFAALASLAALPLAAMGQPRWLAVYPVLAAIALLAASAGIGLCLLLFRLLGARRTREAGQIIATVIGAAFFLLIQARAFLPGGGAAVFGGVQRWALGGAFDPKGPLAWPARAVLGEPAPLLGLVAVSLLVFWAVAAALGRRFSGNVAAAAGAAPGRVSRRPVTARGFRGGVFATVVRKELRLLRRDPTLLSQVLLRAIYVVPLTLVMLKAAPGGADAVVAERLRLASLAGSATFLASQIAGSLAFICISAEDAPDLLASAPVGRRLVRRAKLASALIPAAMLMAAPVAALAWLSPWVGGCAALGAAAAALSSAGLNLWLEKPMPRRAFRNRRQGSAATAIAEIVAGLGWAMAAWLAAVGTAWGALIG